MRIYQRFYSLLLLVLIVANPIYAEADSIVVSSPNFAANGIIPKRFTADGENCSPSLVWSAGPKGTKSWVIVMEDRDVPLEHAWINWIVYGINPGDQNELPEHAPEQPWPNHPQLKEGNNSWGAQGYHGPQLAHGSAAHHYRFLVYALDVMPNLEAGLTQSEVWSAIDSHIVGTGELVGMYER